MNLIEFTNIIDNPGSIDRAQTKDLEAILNAYPYFQTAHFLRLMALKKQHSFQYNDALKKTAAYSTDRALLFDFITNFDEGFHPAPAGMDAQVESNQQVGKDAQSADGDGPEKDGPQKDSPEEVLALGSPLQFSKKDSFSFYEWLQLSSTKPLETEENTEENTEVAETENPVSSTKRNFDLIDRFIAQQPKIQIDEAEDFDDLANDSGLQKEELMTETLARVYVEQKKYDKAIMAFKVLSLKYPEKSSFFADRIEAVNKLRQKN